MNYSGRRYEFFIQIPVWNFLRGVKFIAVKKSESKFE